jgi:hypothetical protein
MMRVLRTFDWRGFRAFDVSRVIELLWALLSRLLSDNNHPFPPLAVPVFGRAPGWRHRFSKRGDGSGESIVKSVFTWARGASVFR